jgi:hypothetical protein
MHSILDITGPTDSSVDLISLDDLKLALGITDNTEDATLQAMITFQSRIITEYCCGPPPGRFAFAEAIETFTFDPYENLRAREALVLSLYPVTEILEVSTAGATASDYHFDPASGKVWLSNNQYPYYWQSYYSYGPWYGPWPGSVMVTYSGGYNLPDEAPARLQRAVIECVSSVRTTSAAGYRDPTIREVQHGDTRISYVSPSFASGSISTGQHFSPSVVDLIKPFRRLYIA